MLNNVGLYGLGTMGQSLVLNMANHGYSVSVFNRTYDKTEKFLEGPAKGKNISGYKELKDFVASLEKPRKIMLMVVAGKVTDAVIDALLPLLEENDIIIDCGNSYYKDTERRIAYCKEKGIDFLGVGVSGGEKGALLGPSIMPSGDKKAMDEVLMILMTISAKAYDGKPCCCYIGEGGSGQFVKMVHNGIEYGDIQIICEAYQIMKNVYGMNNDEIQQAFEKWNQGKLKSYLIEITANIFKVKDPQTGNYLVDEILDTAGQKGTGKWTSMEALDYGVALPTIAESVFARIISANKELRKTLSVKYRRENTAAHTQKDIDTLENAVYFAKIISYTQGFNLIAEASKEFNWNLDLAEIALIWRQGCIIRADFLDDISRELKKDINGNLLLADKFSAELLEYEQNTRDVVTGAIAAKQYIPSIANSLMYFDGITTDRLPANLLQAQRDYFGAHTYKRIDLNDGVSYHTEWE